MTRKIRLYSPLKPIPLARVLEDEMDNEWTESQKDKGRVHGRGTENKFFLKVHNWGQHDDSRFSFEGTMREERDGTMIEGKFGRDSKAKFFVYGWFIFLSLFIVIGIVSTLFIGPPLEFTAMFLGVPLFMMAIGGWIFSRSAKMAPADEKMILAFLADKVKARPERMDI